MTITEALQKEIGKTDLIEIVLTELGITGSTTFTSDAAIIKDRDLAKAHILMRLAVGPDIKESDLTITLSRTEMKEEAQRIFDLYGIEYGSRPSVNSYKAW